MMQTPTRPTVAIACAAVVLTVAVTAVLTASQASSAPQSPPAGAQAPDTQLATIKQYCVSCHNDRTKVAGVSFEGITADSGSQRAEVVEKAVRKLRGRVMPPPGARQPQGDATDSLIAWLET